MKYSYPRRRLVCMNRSSGKSRDVRSRRHASNQISAHVGQLGGGNRTHEGNRAHVPEQSHGLRAQSAFLDVAAKFAKAHDVFVICDDVYTSLVTKACTKATKACTLALRVAMANYATALSCATAFRSRTAMTGWRLLVVVADAPISAQIAKMHQYMVSSVLLFAARGDSSVEGRRAPAREVSRPPRLRACSLEGNRLMSSSPSGAFYVFPLSRNWPGMSSDEFCTRLIAEKGVALVPGSVFCRRRIRASVILL